MSRREHEAWLDQHLWRPSPAQGLEIPSDTTPAAWIADHLHPGSFEVQMMVPDCFESYARIFFPFVGDPIVRDGQTVDNQRINWTDMARRHGRTAHALMEEETISTPRGGDPTDRGVYPEMGTEQYEALLAILVRHTASDQGWFLLWDGFGDVDPRPFSTQTKVEHQWRQYHLLRGPLRAIDEIRNTPSYWWPDDRAWCLCTDIDWSWAYLAGSRGCIDEVARDPLIDAYSTEPTNPARTGMDLINDPDHEIPRR